VGAPSNLPLQAATINSELTTIALKSLMPEAVPVLSATR
jgi:hypothetical protein